MSGNNAMWSGCSGITGFCKLTACDGNATGHERITSLARRLWPQMQDDMRDVPMPHDVCPIFIMQHILPPRQFAQQHLAGSFAAALSLMERDTAGTTCEGRTPQAASDGSMQSTSHTMLMKTDMRLLNCVSIVVVAAYIRIVNSPSKPSDPYTAAHNQEIILAEQRLR